MLDAATDLRRNVEPDRWLVETRHRGRPWAVVVEPDSASGVVVVVTAYEVD